MSLGRIAFKIFLAHWSCNCLTLVCIIIFFFFCIYSLRLLGITETINFISSLFLQVFFSAYFFSSLSIGLKCMNVMTWWYSANHWSAVQWFLIYFLCFLQIEKLLLIYLQVWWFYFFYKFSNWPLLNENIFFKNLDAFYFHNFDFISFYIFYFSTEISFLFIHYNHAFTYFLTMIILANLKHFSANFNFCDILSVKLCFF